MAKILSNPKPETRNPKPETRNPKLICIDAGNTLLKVALMADGAVLSSASFATGDNSGLLRHVEALPQADACILSRSGAVDECVVRLLRQKSAHFTELTAATPLPIRNLYKTPETLGKDRLAAVVGARRLFPGKDILVFDAGTALTIDFIDKEGNYRGGNISPGLNMRFRALHDYTQRLSLHSQTDDFETIGDSTAAAIISGVQNGIIFEMDFYIQSFVKKFPQLVTILTGGDVNFFANKFERRIFAEPNLVFIGLEDIVKFNIEKLKEP